MIKTTRKPASMAGFEATRKTAWIAGLGPVEGKKLNEGRAHPGFFKHATKKSHVRCPVFCRCVAAG